MATFKEIYSEARELENDPTHQPINPEVRKYSDGTWALESGINPAEDVVALCDLDAFSLYFYESYNDDDYEPSEMDEADFLAIISD